MYQLHTPCKIENQILHVKRNLLCRKKEEAQASDKTKMSKLA